MVEILPVTTLALLSVRPRPAAVVRSLGMGNDTLNVAHTAKMIANHDFWLENWRYISHCQSELAAHRVGEQGYTRKATNVDATQEIGRWGEKLSWRRG